MSNDEDQSPSDGTPDPGGESPASEPTMDTGEWPVDFLRPNPDQDQVTEPVASQDAADDWQDRYQRERKRSRILMATTAAAALLFTGTLAFAVADTGASDPTPDAVSGGVAGQGGGSGGFDGRGFGGRGGPGHHHDHDEFGEGHSDRGGQQDWDDEDWDDEDWDDEDWDEDDGAQDSA